MYIKKYTLTEVKLKKKNEQNFNNLTLTVNVTNITVVR